MSGQPYFDHRLILLVLKASSHLSNHIPLHSTSLNQGPVRFETLAPFQSILVSLMLRSVTSLLCKPPAIGQHVSLCRHRCVLAWYPLSRTTRSPTLLIASGRESVPELKGQVQSHCHHLKTFHSCTILKALRHFGYMPCQKKNV